MCVCLCAFFKGGGGLGLWVGAIFLGGVGVGG